MGYCAGRSNFENSSTENSIVEVLPDDYEKIMNDFVSGNVNFSLMAYAADNPIVDKLDEFFDKTNLYDISDFVSGYFDYLANPDYYPEETAPLPVVGKSDSDNPVTSAVIPYHYNAYGKERIIYPSGVTELVVCRFDADLISDSSKAKGHITFTRSNSLGYATSFGFDIRLTNISQTFNSSSGFTFVYKPLATNVTGIENFSPYVGNNYRVSFYSSTVNDINNFYATSDTSLNYSRFINNSTPVINKSTNIFCVSQVFSNDYDFINSVYNYQNNSRTKSVNFYYNNHAGDT
ncbi:MAG: hypothetical protein K2I06_12305, partial [Ruminococcus sp.]|nr:hypothetical protein [Ruminococcus sp.]